MNHSYNDQQDSRPNQETSSSSIPLDPTEVILRVGMFVVLAMVCRFVLPAVIGLIPLPEHSALLVRSVLTSFGAGAIASLVCARFFEDGRWKDAGLGWNTRAGLLRQLLGGLVAGSAAAAFTVVMPMALGWASLVPDSAGADRGGGFAGLASGVLLLLLGAAGEELLFHGYAFQVLLGQHGELPRSSLGRHRSLGVVMGVALIFGWAHVVSNQAPLLAAMNTVAWGFLLGYACWRTGALWLSIGLHFGWNVVFPLFGVNLSGITMGVTNSVLKWNVADLWSGGAYGPEAGVLTSGVVVALFVLLWRVRW